MTSYILVDGTLPGDFGEFQLMVTVCRCQLLTEIIRDIMYELASVGDLPLPQPSPIPSHKRDRDDDDPKASDPVPASETIQPTPAGNPRRFVGAKRVSDAQKARQDQFRSALSSSLSSMHLNGTSNITSSASESYGPPPSSADAGHAPAYSSHDQPPVSAINDGYYSAILASIPPNPAPFDTGVPAMPSGGSPNTTMNSQGGQPLGMDPMFSTQSMMYDQVLTNLSASLMQSPSSPTVQQHEHAAASAQYSSVPPTQDFDGYMASLNGQVLVPDFVSFAADPNALSMWSAAPNGLE